MSVGPDGAVTYTPVGGGARATAGVPVAGLVPERGGPGPRLRQPLAGAPAAPAPPPTDTPGVNGLGQTVGGQLEMSNVDLATEFTNMITAQRGFEASSRVLSTSDEMLQTLVNLKH